MSDNEPAAGTDGQDGHPRPGDDEPSHDHYLTQFEDGHDGHDLRQLIDQEEARRDQELARQDGHELLAFVVPPGIGDISWCYSKLAGLGRGLRFEVCGDRPHRALPYVRLLPLVKEANYVDKVNPVKWPSKVTAAWSGPKLCHWSLVAPLGIELNTWLEEGHRIEEFMPDVPTVHHYDMELPPPARDWRRFVAFYCANAKTVRAWNGWSPSKWAALGKLLMQRYDIEGIVLLGSTNDSGFSHLVVKELLRAKVPTTTTVGMLPIQATLRIIEDSAYLVAFPSGIPILATVMHQPVLMFYPNHLVPLMAAWPAPDVISDGTYQPLPFVPPREAFDVLKEHLPDSRL